MSPIQKAIHRAAVDTLREHLSPTKADEVAAVLGERCAQACIECIVALVNKPTRSGKRPKKAVKVEPTT